MAGLLTSASGRTVHAMCAMSTRTQLHHVHAAFMWGAQPAMTHAHCTYTTSSFVIWPYVQVDARGRQLMEWEYLDNNVSAMHHPQLLNHGALVLTRLSPSAMSTMNPPGPAVHDLIASISHCLSSWCANACRCLLTVMIIALAGNLQLHR